MYRLVIFDLDGTLVDSLDDLANACNEALSSFGFPVHEREKYRYFVGDGILKLIERALPGDKHSSDTIAAVKTRFDAVYDKSYDRHTRPYDGIMELLRGLKEKGILIAVASNKPDEFTKKILSGMFGDIFDYASGKKEGFARKPDPAIALHIMEVLGVRPDETLFVGDSSVDMMTAQNAGCDSVGCTWGFREQSELEENHAVYIAHTPGDISEIICKNT